jgi:protein tyrosine phosphatase (PTP) superfamily phosphohydrolase (DUF442 family)
MKLSLSFINYYSYRLVLWFFILVLSMIIAPQMVYAKCEKPFIYGIKNSCEVIQNSLWRGSKPDMASAAQLLEKDVKTVINLELLHDDKGTFTATRPNLNIEYTLNYYSLPDWEPLAVTSKKTIDRRVEDFIAITRIAPLPIFVHCRSGQNRTGMMIAALHIFKGMPIEQAINDMLSYGGLWSHQNIAYLRTLTPKKRAKMEQNIVLNMRNMKPNSILSCSRIGCFDPEVYQP